MMSLVTTATYRVSGRVWLARVWNEPCHRPIFQRTACGYGELGLAVSQHLPAFERTLGVRFLPE